MKRYTRHRSRKIRDTIDVAQMLSQHWRTDRRCRWLATLAVHRRQVRKSLCVYQPETTLILANVSTMPPDFVNIVDVTKYTVHDDQCIGVEKDLVLLRYSCRLETCKLYDTY